MSSIAIYGKAIFMFCLSSVGMMISNKLAVTELPLPCTLVIVQMIATLILLLPFFSQLESVTIQKSRQWFPAAFLFAAMLFTSMESFLYASVPTVIVIRNVGAIITSVAEYYALGEGVNAEIILSQFAILGGAILYGGANTSFSIVGLFWMLANIFAQTCYGIYVKHMMSNVPEFSSATKYTLALYNNLLAIPLIIILFFFNDEHSVVYYAVLLMESSGVFWIAATCICGFMISTSGFELQKLVSATSFIVINNLTKFFNILIGIFWMRDSMGLWDGSGCAIALLAGAWYSSARYRFKDTNTKS